MTLRTYSASTTTSRPSKQCNAADDGPLGSVRRRIRVRLRRPLRRRLRATGHGRIDLARLDQRARRARLLIKDSPREHGALMEQSGRNPWQPVTNGTAARVDGKEGVDGSS